MYSVILPRVKIVLHRTIKALREQALAADHRQMCCPPPPARLHIQTVFPLYLKTFWVMTGFHSPLCECCMFSLSWLFFCQKHGGPVWMTHEASSFCLSSLCLVHLCMDYQEWEAGDWVCRDSSENVSFSILLPSQSLVVKSWWAPSIFSVVLSKHTTAAPFSTNTMTFIFSLFLLYLLLVCASEMFECMLKCVYLLYGRRGTVCLATDIYTLFFYRNQGSQRPILFKSRKITIQALKPYCITFHTWPSTNVLGSWATLICMPSPLVMSCLANVSNISITEKTLHFITEAQL